MHNVGNDVRYRETRLLVEEEVMEKMRKPETKWNDVLKCEIVRE